MKDQYFSAAEIADMSLPLLPKSKSAVIKKAEKEAWEYVERTGVGGIRKLYKIPDIYMQYGTSGIPIERAKQAALQAYRASKAMGNITDEQFVQLFTTLSNAQEFTGQQDSANHNTRRVKAGKHSQVIVGDSNIQIGKGTRNNETKN